MYDILSAYGEKSGMDRKNIVIAAVALAIIVVGAVITVKRTANKPQPPQWMLDQKVEKIDVKTMEIVTERYGDWEGKYAPDASHLYVNPQTGKHTVANTLKCASCGALIPEAQIPDSVKGWPAKIRFLNAYLCPKCGKPAYVPKPE